MKTSTQWRLMHYHKSSSLALFPSLKAYHSIIAPQWYQPLWLKLQSSFEPKNSRYPRGICMPCAHVTTLVCKAKEYQCSSMQVFQGVMTSYATIVVVVIGRIFIPRPSSHSSIWLLKDRSSAPSPHPPYLSLQAMREALPHLNDIRKTLAKQGE